MNYRILLLAIVPVVFACTEAVDDAANSNSMYDHNLIVFQNEDLDSSFVSGLVSYAKLARIKSKSILCKVFLVPEGDTLKYYLTSAANSSHLKDAYYTVGYLIVDNCVFVVKSDWQSVFSDEDIRNKELQVVVRNNIDSIFFGDEEFSYDPPVWCIKMKGEYVEIDSFARSPEIRIIRSGLIPLPRKKE